MSDGSASHWHTIYPAYLNANRTLAQGRRISQRKACHDPRWQEMRDVLESTGSFQVVGEANKTYPRELDKELPTSRGRIKYQVTGEHERFKSKKEVMLFLADMIPRLKSRTQKGASQAQATEPTAAVAGKKKKGKK